jgi:hypothetical protein
VDQIPLDDKMTQAKNGDGFTPLGPWIETDLDPSDVSIDVEVNGEIVATSSTKLLGWNVVEQLVYLTSLLTLGPGDIVLTGSPATYAQVQPGDFARITVHGIGTLTNPVAGPRPRVSAYGPQGSSASRDPAERSGHVWRDKLDCFAHLHPVGSWAIDVDNHDPSAGDRCARITTSFDQRLAPDRGAILGDLAVPKSAAR